MSADGTTFEVSAEVAAYVSAAFQQNAVPVVQEVVLANGTGGDLKDIVVSITSEPPFIVPLRLHVERIAHGQTHHVRTLNIQLEAGFLRRLTEGARGELHLAATAAGELLAESRIPIQLYPPSHWGGSQAAPELLAAFVRPNEPAVDAILRDAQTRLAAAGKSGAIDGYRSGTRKRAWELAGAIWSALAARGIGYVLPPASFERDGQKIRAPGDIVERRLATCLDSALLFAACLEQARLNPLVVLTGSHAFVGLWLKDDGFSVAIVDDAQMLRKRRDLDDMIFIETTLLTHTPPARFQQAVDQAARLLELEAADPFQLAVDIKRARSAGVRPLDLGEGAVSVRPLDEGFQVDVAIEDAPTFVEDLDVAEASDASVDRLERWKRKLLDLTLRNKLLNFRDTKKAVPLECYDPARLEDMIAGGQRFKILARTKVLGEGDERDATLFHEQRHDDGRRRFVTDAMDRGDLHAGLAEQELEGRLTDLYRTAISAFEEGGANVLFLAFGFLSWTQKEGSALHKAPLVLLPVSLQRSSVRSGFRLAVHEEEARFNPTLLQLLRQDFKLVMPELERELPTDANGIDIARIWQIVRTHILPLKGWEVTSDVVLSSFSFTKFLMWKDLVERMDALKRNPVVKHLIDTPKHTYGDGGGFPAPESLDKDHRPAEFFTPLMADSSQLAAVLAAAGGKDFVLFGPPGTGKSQTIANMISQCLAQGRTVLFVSQKTAALEVVQRRLRDIGLGEYCLEVHSTKAQKSTVLRQLKASWHERTAPSADDWQVATDEFERLRNELNGVVSALHRRRANGMTAYGAFGRAIAVDTLPGDCNLDFGETEHSPQDIAHFRELMRLVRTDAKGVGNPARHPLRGISATQWSPVWRNRLIAACEALVAASTALDGKAATFAQSIGLTVPDTAVVARALRTLGKLLRHPGAASGVRFLETAGPSRRRALAELADLQQLSADIARGLGADYRGSVFGEDLRGLLDEWIAATNANFVVRGGRQKQVRQKLQPFTGSEMPDNIGQDLVLLIEMQDFARRADALGDTLGVFAGLFAGLDTNLDAMTGPLRWADHAQALAEWLAGTLGMHVDQVRGHIVLLLTEYGHLFQPHGAAAESFHRFQDADEAFRSALAELNDVAGRPADAALAIGEGWLAATAATATRWKGGINLAPDWCHWNQTVGNVRDAELGPIINAIEVGRLAADDAPAAFEAAYARWWSDRVMAEDPVLRAFTAIRHEDTLARFRAADVRVAELTKRVVRARLGGDIPKPNAFGADLEWGTLANELVKRRSTRPLRQLFAQIPTVMTRLTPCVMMSPLSIAQYLPPDSKPFDVVIFDEASQIPPWDAIGAIARGRQVVMVGDPEQLPPTSVGDRGVDDIDDGIDVEDQESILDECIAANIPTRELTWHYRSRHESLIAFSNNEYYRGRLVTFPSPVTDDRAVRYVHVPNGVYERGRGRVNREEARAVVAEIIRRLKEPEFAVIKSSLGVVTFNGEQQRLIENLLDQERRSHPELELYFDPARWHEPVFVKNLENVQGDERDVILFSVAVASDATGRPVATISSLNKQGGHRRLNVAITRARQEMVVFATLRPEQIDLSRSGARGVRDFKHFLEYAERGARAMAEAFAASGTGTESPFEDAVKAALEARDWVVHTQIGVSGYRIDLGIVDPDAPGRYLAGVECDGAMYHSSATARDRDRLREHVLTQLNWRIRRVWSTDWWLDSSRAFDRLHTQLVADLEAARSARLAAARPSPPVAHVDIEPENEERTEDLDEVANDIEAALTELPPPPTAPTQPAGRQYADRASLPQVDLAIYREVDFSAGGFAPDPARFYDPLYRGELRRMVSHVIAVEGPIFEYILFYRMARAHGFSRAASRIRDTVATAISPLVERTLEDERAVLWPLDTTPGSLVPFRHANPIVRDHADIPLIELASLADTFQGIGVNMEEVVRGMAAHFGLGRLRESSRTRFEAAARLAGCS